MCHGASQLGKGGLPSQSFYRSKGKWSFFCSETKFQDTTHKKPLMSGRQERKRISSHTILSDPPNRWQLEIGRFRGGSSTCWRGWIDLLGGIDVGCGSIGEESFGYFKWFEWGCEFCRLFRAFVGCLTWWGVLYDETVEHPKIFAKLWRWRLIRGPDHARQIRVTSAKITPNEALVRGLPPNLPLISWVSFFKFCFNESWIKRISSRLRDLDSLQQNWERQNLVEMILSRWPSFRVFICIIYIYIWRLVK